MSKLVCGVGINDYEGRIKVDGKHIKSYEVWRDMLKRCYVNKNSTYKDCTVCEEWLSFKNFKLWYDNQYKEDGWQLDKDILVHNNKVYSPDTCRFVPRDINTLIVRNSNQRGEYLLGITRHSYYTKDGIKRSITSPFSISYLAGEKTSVHKTEIDAHRTWRTRKSKIIKSKVEDFKEVLDKDIIKALLFRAENLLDFSKDIDQFY